ncbi:MAG: PAS domain S-box protein [Leptospiraceae bacterium]|nr:PAS domain S-box protein [Leptospiraceae bacterium]
MDIKTLFISVSIISIPALALSIYIYWVHSRTHLGARYWLLAVALITVSTLLFALVKVVPPFVTIHAGNTMLLSAPIFITISIGRFFTKPPGRILIGMEIGAIIIFNILAPFASTRERIALFALIFAFLWFYPGLFLVRQAWQGIYRVLAFIFFTAAAVSLFRAVGTWLGPDLDTLLEGDLVQQISIAFMLIIWMVMITGYILLQYSRALDQVNQETAKLRLAIDQNPQAISISDVDGRITTANEAFAQSSGYTIAELIGQNHRILKSGQHPRSMYQDMWQELLAGNPWKGEILNKKKNGELYWEYAVISPILTAGRQVSGFFAVKENITEQKCLQEFKSRIENLMKHDLKTPLNAVINLPDLILEGANLDDDQKEYLQIIQKSGETMLDQISRSLDLYKIESGQYALHKEPVSITEIVEEIEMSLTAATVEQSIVIEKQLNVAASSITTDRILLYRLLSNIIKNAVEAAPARSQVTIQAEQSAAGLQIHFHNVGVIPVEIRPLLFNTIAPSQKQGGTGLGTYSARLIADALGFQISFVSTAESGTCVTISIPIDKL